MVMLFVCFSPLLKLASIQYVVVFSGYTVYCPVEPTDRGFVFGKLSVVNSASLVFHEITADSLKPAFSFTRDERNIISLLAILELNKIVYSILNLS